MNKDNGNNFRGAGVNYSDILMLVIMKMIIIIRVEVVGTNAFFNIVLGNGIVARKQTSIFIGLTTSNVFVNNKKKDDRQLYSHFKQLLDIHSLIINYYRTHPQQRL